MVTFAVETKMHYPVMTEQQVAARWKVSLKTQVVSVVKTDFLFG